MKKRSLKNKISSLWPAPLRQHKNCKNGCNKIVAVPIDVTVMTKTCSVTIHSLKPYIPNTCFQPFLSKLFYFTFPQDFHETWQHPRPQVSGVCVWFFYLFLKIDIAYLSLVFWKVRDIFKHASSFWCPCFYSILEIIGLVRTQTFLKN